MTASEDPNETAGQSVSKSIPAVDYLKVSGLNDDFSWVLYELTQSSLDDLVEHAIQFGQDGGSRLDVKVEIISMTPDEFNDIPEAD